MEFERKRNIAPMISARNPNPRIFQILFLQIFFRFWSFRVFAAKRKITESIKKFTGRLRRKNGGKRNKLRKGKKIL